jgi:hypothetical protein
MLQSKVEMNHNAGNPRIGIDFAEKAGDTCKKYSPAPCSLSQGGLAWRVFMMPNPGTYAIGTSHKHCEICVHDLYVGRVHCQVDVDDDGVVVVTDQHPVGGTFINKVKIDKQVMRLGDVLRVGNTHLRLEPAGMTPSTMDYGEAEEEVIQGEIIDDKSGPPPLVTAEMLGELQGYTLGHYLLDELLGRSPFKAVFRATDQKSGHTVSLKVLAPQFPATNEELQHFITVMKRALPIRHEHLITLIGAGRTGHYTWIAREFVDGKSLVDVLSKLSSHVKPKWKSGLRLLKELAGALDFIHRHHLAHGNITPNNIMIRSEDKAAKLANLMFDPALAGSKLLEAAREAKRAQDVTFFAPEQCRDEAVLDRHADLYNLGAVVYARMTGRPPFLGKSPEETMKMIRTKSLTPPSKWNADIPEELDAMVVKLLEKKPHDRYNHAAELLADLEAFEETLEEEQ